MDSLAVNKRFTDYYTAKGYYFLPRAPMLDTSIPMSFVMSAGLVQIETSLSKITDRPSNQFVLVQSCFRHFDLDTVGKDNIHLSFFEMPGAFTFGPNNRSETIQNMWFLATSVLGIDKNRIWATYYKGGNILNNEIPEDTLTHNAWKMLGVPESQLVGLDTSNYWIQGRGIENLSIPRKCGPNTELFYDFGIDKACSPNCIPGCGCGRFVEFSNSLFISFQLDEKTGALRKIPEPFTETVIGTERVAMILQGVSSVFETNDFAPIFSAIRSYIHISTHIPAAIHSASEKVIADYIKALYCLTADGAPPPGKNGRERIIKLIIRGILTYQNILGIDQPGFLPALVDCVAENISTDVDKKATKKQVLSYFALESPRFFQTIENGRLIFNQLLAENQGCTLSGSQMVYLEKYQGLPHIMAILFLFEHGLPFLEQDYLEALNDWKKTMLH